ncbi:MAG: hypothetical protein BJ554DRAFT_2495, partial [Olpidium bornovanus]
MADARSPVSPAGNGLATLSKDAGDTEKFPSTSSPSSPAPDKSRPDCGAANAVVGNGRVDPVSQSGGLLGSAAAACCDDHGRRHANGAPSPGRAAKFRPRHCFPRNPWLLAARPNLVRLSGAYSRTSRLRSTFGSAMKRHSIVKFASRKLSTGTISNRRHYYPRVLNAAIHPLIGSFFSLGNERIVARYAHLNPNVNQDVLRILLSYSPEFFQWAGMLRRTAGERALQSASTCLGGFEAVTYRTIPSPSGQKSMPLLEEQGNEQGGYRVVLESAFKSSLERADPSLGDLAVVYDKNGMEASGYAAAMAEVTKERVWLVEYYDWDLDPPVKWDDGAMSVKDKDGGGRNLVACTLFVRTYAAVDRNTGLRLVVSECIVVWHPIRACFRYVTQKPWNRFPLSTKTVVTNSITACLSGGRNKMMAAYAYELFNSQVEESGLAVRAPETIRSVSRHEIPMWVDSMGGHAVLKVPYSNAGQGVYTITNPEELRWFMAAHHDYDKFIVQSLVGNASWSSTTKAGKFYHVGTIPNKHINTFVTDLRMMVTADKTGFRPVCIYARKARKVGFPVKFRAEW